MEISESIFEISKDSLVFSDSKLVRELETYKDGAEKEELNTFVYFLSKKYFSSHPEKTYKESFEFVNSYLQNLPVNRYVATFHQESVEYQSLGFFDSIGCELSRKWKELPNFFSN